MPGTSRLCSVSFYRSVATAQSYIPCSGFVRFDANLMCRQVKFTFDHNLKQSDGGEVAFMCEVLTKPGSYFILSANFRLFLQLHLEDERSFLTWMANGVVPELRDKACD